MNRLEEVIAISESVDRLATGWVTKVDGYRVQHPGLIRQARLTMVHGTHDSDDSRKVHQKAIDSPPPMPEHIFMTILEVETEIRLLGRVYGVERARVEDVLRGLIGACASLADKQVHQLDRELAGLRRRLEVALAWEPEDRAIRNAVCPECQTKNMLRVRLDEHGPASAYCMSCLTKWSYPELSALAEYINKEAQQ